MVSTMVSADCHSCGSREFTLITPGKQLWLSVAGKGLLPSHENKHPCCLDLFVFSQRAAAPCPRGRRQRLLDCEPLSLHFVLMRNCERLQHARGPSCAPLSHRLQSEPLFDLRFLLSLRSLQYKQHLQPIPHLQSVPPWLRPPLRSSWER